MSNAAAQTKTQAALSEALSKNALPHAARPDAQKLLDRLDTPTRLGIFGPPGAGKTTLLNLLVGYDVVPEGMMFPTTQLSYSAEPRAVLTLSDGSKAQMNDIRPDLIADQNPLMVQLEMDLPALKKISVLEVVTSDDQTEQARALAWASNRVDIALWATQEFSAQEQLLWQDMPDHIKDHAFLLMTKVDTIYDPADAEYAMGGLRSVAADQFSQIMQIATLDALNARGADGQVDKGMMRASGGMALISAILRQVEMGRQHFVDQADMLLRKHADTPAVSVKPKRPSQLRVVSTTPPRSKPVPVPEVRVTSRAKSQPFPTAEAEKPSDAQDASGVMERLKSAQKTASRVVEAAGPDTSPTIVGLGAEARPVFEEAVAHLTKAGEKLHANDAITATSVMAASVDAVMWVSDHLSDNGPQSDTLLARARDAAIDASDLTQLMQIEKRDSAAIEAVSVMLQLKRTMQADLAA